MTATRTGTTKTHLLKNSTSNTAQVHPKGDRLEDLLVGELPLDRFLLTATSFLVVVAIAYVVGCQVGLLLVVAIVLRLVKNQLKKGRVNNPVVWSGCL